MRGSLRHVRNYQGSVKPLCGPICMRELPTYVNVHSEIRGGGMQRRGYEGT